MTAPTRALLEAGRRANAIVRGVYNQADRLECAREVRCMPPRRGCNAVLVDAGDPGGFRLVFPGTGYGGGRFEAAVDWWRNLVSGIPAPAVREALTPSQGTAAAVKTIATSAVTIPKQGTSGAKWGWGFWDGANDVLDWIEQINETIAFMDGHSQGGAIGGLVHWSWWKHLSGRELPESHMIAPAGVALSAVDEAPKLHGWGAPDDLVWRLPPWARHPGQFHLMPRCTSPGWWADFHTPEAYDRRFAQMLAGCGA